MAGPFDNWTGIALNEATKQLADNEKSIQIILDFIADEPAAFTASGRDIKNMSTSGAKFGMSELGKRLQPGGLPEVENKTGKQLMEIIASKKTENEILKAAIAAQQLTTSGPFKPEAPPVLSRVGTGLSKLNPILNFIQGMTFTGDLNSNEAEELAKRRK